MGKRSAKPVIDLSELVRRSGYAKIMTHKRGTDS